MRRYLLMVNRGCRVRGALAVALVLATVLAGAGLSHPYTVALMASVPSPDPEQRSEMKVIGGEVPSAVHVPPGCRFNPRCRFRMEVCDRVEPQPHDAGGGHLVACHLPDDFDLAAAPEPPAAVAKEDV